jgi:hypothetical protein
MLAEYSSITCSFFLYLVIVGQTHDQSNLCALFYVADVNGMRNMTLHQVLWWHYRYKYQPTIYETLQLCVS